LDPIDGTKGYLRGGQYAVALALIEGGRPVLGVLGCPNLGMGAQEQAGAGGVAVAWRGGGAWFSAGSEDWAPLRVSDRREVAAARMLRSFESGHTNTSQIDALAAALGVAAAPVLMDSQAKYAVLAGGGAELLFRLLNPGKEQYKECIWDQAAGAILLEEAGGRITDLRGEALDFGQGRKLSQNTGVFASNGWLHEAGLEALARIGAV
jgi:3'(2'), 5'-bisphosphate nucleotidase